MDVKSILDTIYLDPAHPGGLGGSDRLFRQVEKHGITKDQVNLYLQQNDAYTEHKARRKKFKRRKVISVDVGDQHQIDLADMQKFAQFNDGYRYILMVVDCFSRFAWAVPVKNKTPPETIRGLTTVYRSAGLPLRCQSDNGKEFTATSVRDFFKDCGVTFFTTTNDDIKCAMVERLNRTIKERLWLYMTHHNHYRYIDILPAVMDSYNNTVHSSTGFAPADVDQIAAMKIREKMLTDQSEETAPRFNIGDHVRLAKNKLTFEKGYETNFTEEIFEIVDAQRRNRRNVYIVKDLNGEIVLGSFYEPELSKVTMSEKPLHKISRVLRQRTVKGRVQYLVRWKGYGSAYDSWEYRDDVI